MVRKLVPDVVHRQRLLKLPPTATVREAAQRMARRKVRSTLVVDDGGALQGIFTGTDLIDAIAHGLDPATTALSEVMTANPETIRADANALEALRRMHLKRYRHLPVVDPRGKLVGIVSRRDFLGYEEDEIEHQEKIWEEL